MCITFMGQNQKLYLYPEDGKEGKWNLEKIRDSICGDKSSVHKMTAYIQHKDHSFIQQQMLFACFKTKIRSQNCVVRFMKGS